MIGLEEKNYMRFILLVRHVKAKLVKNYDNDDLARMRRLMIMMMMMPMLMFHIKKIFFFSWLSQCVSHEHNRKLCLGL